MNANQNSNFKQTTIVYNGQELTTSVPANRRRDRYMSRRIELTENNDGTRTIKYIHYYDYKPNSSHPEHGNLERAWTKWMEIYRRAQLETHQNGVILNDEPFDPNQQDEQFELEDDNDELIFIMNIHNALDHFLTDQPDSVIQRRIERAHQIIDEIFEDPTRTTLEDFEDTLDELDNMTDDLYEGEDPNHEFLLYVHLHESLTQIYEFYLDDFQGME